jgi:hypothetical protein
MKFGLLLACQNQVEFEKQTFDKSGYYVDVPQMCDHVQTELDYQIIVGI